MKDFLQGVDWRKLLLYLFVAALAITIILGVAHTAKIAYGWGMEIAEARVQAILRSIEVQAEIDQQVYQAEAEARIAQIQQQQAVSAEYQTGSASSGAPAFFAANPAAGKLIIFSLIFIGAMVTLHIGLSKFQNWRSGKTRSSLRKSVA